MKKHCQCGGDIVDCHDLPYRDNVHDKKIVLDVLHGECASCHEKYLDFEAKRDEILKSGIARGEIVLKNHPFNEIDWVDSDDVIRDFGQSDFFDGLHVCLFYAIVNGHAYVFRPSYEQHMRVHNGGLFWIGDYHDGFYSDGDDFGNSLCIQSLRAVDKNVLSLFWSREWRTVDLSEYSDGISDIGSIRHYGYGGIIWNNGFSLSNRELFEKSR